jgi:methionyl-tRNA formyltransferase
MNIVYLGSGQFGIRSLEALNESGHDLKFIVTQPARAGGRGKKAKATAVADWANINSKPLAETQNVNSPEVVGKIASFEPELIVVIAFGQKIGNDVINLPARDIINVHASLLPKYRGAAPVNWAILKGEAQTGVSIISVAEKMDAGDIISRTKTEIAPNETAGELHDKLARLAAPLLINTIDKIASGTAHYIPQDHSKATLAPKLKKSDGFLDFSEAAETLLRKILGFFPWPGASAIYHSNKTGKPIRVTIALAKVVKKPNPENLLPGTLDEELNVICGGNALRIIKIKPADGALMEFRDFINGRATCPGDTFTKIQQNEHLKS